jgi:hypothetical protein
MGKSSSDQTISSNQPAAAGTRDPQVFAVSSDPEYLKSVFAQCRDVPATHATYRGIYPLMEALAGNGKINLAFAILVERAASAVDTLALRQCKLDYPQVNFIVLVRAEVPRPVSIARRTERSASSVFRGEPQDGDRDGASEYPPVQTASRSVAPG